MASVDEQSPLGGDVTYGGFPLIIDYHSYSDDVDGRVSAFFRSLLLCRPRDTNGTKSDDTNDDGDDDAVGADTG